MYKFRKFIGTILVFTLFATRVFVLSPTFALDGPPPPPSAPSAPSVPHSAPSAPSLSENPPAPPLTVPTMESSPPSVPTTPPLPTSESQNTSGVLPTNQPEPTSSTLNTTGSENQPSDSPSETVNTSGNETGNETGSGNTSDSGSSGFAPTGLESYKSSEDVNDPANVSTGAGSQNEAYENLNKKLEVMNQNLAELQNKVDAVSKSGFNYANFNTLDGTVFTGDVVASVNLLNKLNSNMTGEGGFSVFNIYGTYLNDIIFKMADGNANGSFAKATPTISKNINTGAGSTNIADASNTFTVKEANGNDAKLTNDINIEAVSGGNSSSFNTGNGIVKTGDATAVGNVVNMTNTNLNVSKWLWGVVNIFGTMLGNIIMPQNESTGGAASTSSGTLVENANTGSLSNNTAVYDETNTATFENTNTADIGTTINASSNTGNNTSDANTGGGLIASGNSDIAVSNSNIVNQNTVKEDDTVWMVVVNEAGKWVGHIIGAPWGSTSSSNALPINQTTSGAKSQYYSVESVNNGTGMGSDNYSSYKETNETSVSNNNTASIDNNVNINADTGNNTASNNTGAGVILTGDAKAGLNVVNMANTNVTAKKFVAILVNVLGSWLGDVVTPGQQSSTNPINSSSGTSNSTSGIGGTPDDSILPVLPTMPVLPTIAPVQENYVEEPIVFETYTPQSTVNYVYTTYYYTQAVNQVKTTKKNIITQKPSITPEVAYVGEQGRVIQRGLFLSPAFAKATESSLPGILLGGMSFKVTNAWLSVLPLALFIFLIRRRKKYNLEKYLNMLLSIVL